MVFLQSAGLIIVLFAVLVIILANSLTPSATSLNPLGISLYDVSFSFAFLIALDYVVS